MQQMMMMMPKRKMRGVEFQLEPGGGYSDVPASSASPARSEAVGFAAGVAVASCWRAKLGGPGRRLRLRLSVFARMPWLWGLDVGVGNV